MNLNELKLRSFRNYQEIAAQFDPGVNLIVGDNAQGKTNLLEAISYLGSGKSFRAQKTSEWCGFRKISGRSTVLYSLRSGSRASDGFCFPAPAPGSCG